MDELFGTLFGNTPLSQQLMYLQMELGTAIWETIYSTIVATFFSYVIGLPLGVILVTGEKGGVRPLPGWLMKVLNTVVNLLRSVPFLILMVMVIPLSRMILGTSVGTTASIIPLICAAFPFVARLVEASLRETDKGILEAAQAMGCTPMQIIRKVMLPEALPSLLIGFTTAFITILSYGAMSGAIGGGGLGSLAINYGYQRKMYFILYVSVVILVVMVQVFQSLGTYFAVSLDRRITNKRSKAAGKKHRAEKAGLQ